MGTKFSRGMIGPVGQNLRQIEGGRAPLPGGGAGARSAATYPVHNRVWWRVPKGRDAPALREEPYVALAPARS